MSGGTFDYAQRRLLEIPDKIEEVLGRQGTLLPEQGLTFRKEHYKEYPEDAVYETFSPEVQQRLREAIKALKRAYIYAQRVDWFLSGDDTEVSFLERLEEELKELEEK